jgi:ABC-type multidrug transport system ATPase subunit
LDTEQALENQLEDTKFCLPVEDFSRRNLKEKINDAPMKIAEYPFLSTDQRKIKVQLTWKNIIVWPMKSDTCFSCGRDKVLPDETSRVILREVSGTVRPGQFLSIIGSTGAGKTTLLQLLSGKMFPHNLAWRGTIEINGRPRDDVDYSRFTAFVQQDDILMENLSVRECLEFAANVKSPGIYEERMQRVMNLMNELELIDCQNIHCGSPVLRKGEKKRASIGVELITNPSLLYVDEPTTGMDSFTAEKLVEILGRLAKKGRTIIATIHQPNSEIFAMFDQLMIIALGRTIYFNEAKEAVGYFDRLGYECPKKTNPAEYFMKILSAENFMKEDDEGDVLEIAKKRYEDAVVKMHEQYHAEGNDMRCNADVVTPDISGLSDSELEKIKYVAPWCTQFLYLCKRSSIANIRSPQSTIIRLLTTVVVMVLGMALYWRQGSYGHEDMQGRIGTQFFIVTFAFLQSMQNIVLIFPEERAVFLREQASSLYSISAYFVGKVLAELPLNLFTPLLGFLICFWSWDMNSVHRYNFWLNLLAMELMYLAGTGYGLVLGSIVSDRSVMIALLPVVTMPMLLLSGFFVDIGTGKHIMWLLQFISPCKYIFTIGMRNELEDSPLTVPTVLRSGTSAINQFFLGVYRVVCKVLTSSPGVCDANTVDEMIDQGNKIAYRLLQVDGKPYLLGNGQTALYRDGNYVIESNWEYLLNTFDLAPFSWWENILAACCLIVGSHVIAYTALSIFGKRV